MRTTRREFLEYLGSLGVAASAAPWLASCARPAADVATAVTELSTYDAMGLAELVRAGEVTPLELVEDTLRRIDRVNDKIHAVLPELFDVEQARERARSMATNGVPAGPLGGVPVLLKNLIEYKDGRVDSGSRLVSRRIESLGHPVDGESSAFVMAMESGGMIITGLTNSPEFGLIDCTEPVLHGPSRSPWNLDRTTGGSSGGTGAAVAAGVVPLAHGNDGGGSIRIPASHCGLFGLKPTRAREAGNLVSGEEAVLALSSNLCLSRTVRDTAAFLSVVERRDNPELPPVGMVEGPSAAPRRIALLLTSFEGKAPEPDVERAVRDTASLCTELGHQVEEIELPIDGPAFIDAFIGLWASSTLGIEAEVAEWLGAETKPEDVLEPWTLGLIGMAKKRGRESCIQTALVQFKEASARIVELFGRFDLLLSPTLRTPPFHIGDHSPTLDFEVCLPRVLDVVGYTPLHNAVGTPAMSVPLHWTEDGLPVGSQFAAAHGNERLLLELAYALETARPWRDRHPPVWAGTAA